METIGDRIRHFAKTRYGTQTAFAEALGMSTGQLGDYVSGKKEPGQKIMAKFRAAGMSIDWLLSGEGHPDLYDEGDEPEDGAVEFLSGGPPQDEYRIFDVETMKLYTQEEYNELLREREAGGKRRGANN